MAKKKPPRKITVPPAVLERLTRPKGKFDIIWRHLSDDGTMVHIDKDVELERRAIEIGLKQMRDGEKGGKQSKTRYGIRLAIRWYLENKSLRVSSRKIWNHLLRFHDVEPLKIMYKATDGARKYEVYGVDAGEAGERLAEMRIAEDGETDDHVKYLRFRAFEGYVSRLKKARK